MKKTTTYLALVLAAAMLSSCNDWLTEDTPGTNKRGDYFVSTETATEVVNAAYMPLMWEYGNKSTYYCEWFIGDIVSDDALKGGGSLSDMADAYDMENFKTNVDNSLLRGYYEAQWQGIQRANLAIESIEPLEVGLDANFTEAMKARLLAEARFLRAYYYFRLVRVFGGMPLNDRVIDSSNKINHERASQLETYDFIITDLLAAQEALPLKARYAAADMGRITQGTAQAMLLKAYLYKAGFERQQGVDPTDSYTQAAKWGEEVVKSQQYSLCPVYFDNFTLAGENGPESVFEIQYIEDPRSDYGEGEGFSRGTFTLILQRTRSTHWGESGWGFDHPTQNLYDEYEPGDLRRDATILDFTDYMTTPAEEIYLGNHYLNLKNAQMADNNGQPYHLTHHSRGPLNYRLIRYSDVLLMLAEAYCELGDLGRAKPLLNQVRDRVGLPAFPYTATIQGKSVTYAETQDGLRDAIRHERRVELAMEGHRWFDLLRWGIAAETMAAYIAGETPEAQAEYAGFVKGKHELMPIPSQQIDLGAGPQNPGY